MAGAMFLASCKKEPESVSTVVNVSYPSLVLKGDQIISTSVGTGTYTDPGATGTDDITGASLALTPVTNSVDLTKPGFYSVKYTMKNSNGYITTKIRLVLVTPVSPAVDLSGTYARTSNGQTVTVTKKGTGLYTTNNIGGVAGRPEFIFDVYFGQTSDTTIAAPPQPSPLGGEVSIKNGKLTVSSADTLFSYTVLGTLFAENTRTFSHQ